MLDVFTYHRPIKKPEATAATGEGGWGEVEEQVLGAKARRARVPFAPCGNPGTEVHMSVPSASLAQACGNPGTFFSDHRLHLQCLVDWEETTKTIRGDGSQQFAFPGALVVLNEFAVLAPRHVMATLRSVPGITRK